nr:MAG TPA: hypothetical protein [Caudoviricetes sp.]
MSHSDAFYTLDGKLIDRTQKTALTWLYGAVSVL